MDQRFTEKIDAAKASMFQRLDEDRPPLLEEAFATLAGGLKRPSIRWGNASKRAWASGAGAITGIQQGQALVEARLLEIEKRLHLPPAA